MPSLLWGILGLPFWSCALSASAGSGTSLRCSDLRSNSFHKSTPRVAGKAPIGPVGLLLKSCSMVGIAVGPTGVAEAQGEIPLNLIGSPWQQLKRPLQDRACRNAVREAEQKRGAFGGSGELD
eukprot:2614244-Alexandrium_andersonii.AAC.1